MPAKINVPSYLSKVLHSKKPFTILALLAVVGAAAWAKGALAATTSPTTTSAMTPALRLAVGTVKLEGTAQAVDAASAANLLPLWQLLEQLDTSGSAAPQEITAVIDEIKLSMTSAQIKAIDAMSISQNELGLAPSTSTAARSTSTQAASASSVDPMLTGGNMGGAGAPMDGGGPMPSSGSQSGSAAKSSTSTALTPIKEVIQLLQNKVQG